MLNQIRPELRPYVIPFGSLFIIFIFTLVGGSFILRQINSIRNESSIARREIEILESRLSVLQSFSASPSFMGFVNTTLLAVPDSSPSLLVASQVRNAAAASGVTLEDMSINSIESPEEKEINETNAIITLSGTHEEVSSFTNFLTSSLPLTNLINLSFSSNRGLVQADIELLSFWSPLPSTLPSLSEAITGLSSSESETLSQVEQFAPPALNILPPAQPPAPRENPFFLNQEISPDDEVATDEASLSI